MSDRPKRRILLSLTNNVQQEAEESVVLGKRNKVRVDKDNVLEVVDDRFSVQEEVGNDEEVPGDELVAGREHRCAHQFRVLLHLSSSPVFFLPAAG
jgi:hypothetical protein